MIREFVCSKIGTCGVAIVALGLVAACGGQVVYVEDDGSGAGGSGAAGPGPGPGPGPGSTSTGPGIETVCQGWCNAYAACLGEPSCVDTCESLFDSGCEPELAAFLTCLTNNFTGNCEDPIAACSAQQQAYEACLEGPSPCTTDFCDGAPDGGCYCSGICFNELKLEQQCYLLVGDGNGGQPGPPPPPPSDCDCYLDGSYIGTCENVGFACSIEEGCCQAFVGQDL